MQSIQIGGLSDFENDLEKILNDSPSARRDLHERIGNIIKEEVDSKIATSGLKDNNDNIKEWQNVHIGSGGGYAAVRAEKGSTGNSSKGAITNYLENGHKIVRPSGSNKNYRPNIKKPYVDGYHFYQSASTSVESKVLSEVERFVDELSKKLESEA